MNEEALATDEPLVSVIIPVYKTEKFLEKCVSSVLNQTYGNIEIILIDDGSPDGSPAICDALSAEHEKIRVIHKENGGLSSARNRGIDEAAQATQFILFLDSDDTLCGNAIEGMVDEALKYDADIVFPDRYIKVFESTGESVVARHFPESMDTDNPIDFALDIMIELGRAWRASSVLYSFKAIEESEARFPEGRISEDICFNLQLLSHVKRIAVYKQPTLNNLKRDGSITATYQPNFEKDIWYIDSVVLDFLNKVGRADKESLEKADSLLCRNLVVYLFSVLSHKNSMPYEQKVKKAESILADSHSRNVVRKKCKAPYFESKKSSLAVKVVYFLLRTGQDKLAYRILSVI